MSEGHPDKVCDRISDTILDAYLAEMPEARSGIETLATTNRVVIAGEGRAAAAASPSITAETRAKVAASRANQPVVSEEGACGSIPVSSSRPCVGRIP